MNCFYYESKFKNIFMGGGGGGGGTRISEIFFTKNPDIKIKKKNITFVREGRERGGGGLE